MSGSVNLAASEVDKSIYDLNPPVDASVIASSAAIIVIPYAFSSKFIRPRCPCDPNEVNGFDRGVIGNTNPFLDSVSDVSVGIAIAAPVFLDAFEMGINSAFFEDITVYMETLTLSGALTTLSKYVVQRPLPEVYAGLDPKLEAAPRGYRSFYSGHASTSFSALTAASLTYNLRHPTSIWPWIITSAFGTSVALERVAAGKHFYTDVIIGALAGTGVGLLIPWLHRRNNLIQGESNRVISLAPTENGMQLTVSWMY